MTRARAAVASLAALILAVAVGFAVPAPAAAQKAGGTLTIVRPTDPVSLDPQLETTAPGAWVYFNMLEPLLTLDEKMQIRPALAASYEVMSPTKVRFKLRPGVKFHDGTPLNAAAVKFTFERALRGNPPARWASLAGPLAGAEVVDDLTVDVMTREPYGPILRTLAMYCTGIVSPTAVQKMGEGFSRAPVGTGPFRFVEWKTNTHVILERNPDYWGDKALLDRVIFKVVPEEGARMIALQTGDADMVLLPAPAQLAAIKRDPKYTVHEVVGGRVVFAGMNAAVPPLDDVRVRTALLFAVDRKAILDNILEGSAVAARGVLAPSVFGFKDMQLDRLYPFDRAKAKALLAQAGWTPGPDGITQWPIDVAKDLPRNGPRTLSQGRRDHRGDPGHAEGGRGRGQGAVPRVGHRLHPVPLRRIQGPHVHPGLGDLERGRRLLAVRPLPQQAGAAHRVEHLALRERQGRLARGAGAAQPEPDRAREAIR